jgi:Nif-specific regulatory protein
MTTAVALVDQQELIRLSLRTLLNQTSATFVGYLGLDPSELTPKMVVPERVPMDITLSKRLTEQVRLTKKRAWLFGDSSDPQKSNSSLSAFTDAVCLPITLMNGEPIAAIHAYRAGRNFIERDVQFLEAVSSFLTPALENHRNRRKILAENLRLRCASSTADELIGDSSALMNLRMQIGRAAPLPFTVLINGECGSGKELVALALHRHSTRAGGPIVVVNCAAIAPSLLEAELFGFRKGAFAGADRDQAGMFEQADEGTLFLDEVADLSLECQAKLLRVIEGKSFRPVGGAREVTVDVRVVAASHRDLEQEVKAGRFRQDLLFRLKVITIRVPALREHSEDILELSRFFLERLSHQLRKQLRLSPEAEQRLLDHSWPGNVRQLRAVLESSAVMTDGDVIEIESLGLGLPTEIPTPVKTSVEVPSSMDMDDLETWAIRRALKHTAGNVSQAARVLGISRDTLHTKLKKKNIDRVELLSNTTLG